VEIAVARRRENEPPICEQRSCERGEKKGAGENETARTGAAHRLHTTQEEASRRASGAGSGFAPLKTWFGMWSVVKLSPRSVSKSGLGLAMESIVSYRLALPYNDVANHP
jgi:hypothetical protein